MYHTLHSVAGSGKGKQVNVIGIILTGFPPATIPEAQEPEEFRKRITALLAAGDPIAWLDDVRQLGGAVLNALLTSTVWRDRLLGRSEAVTLPNLAVWMSTGNNTTIVGDTHRRVLPVRLEPAEEHPERRTGFAHPDLLGWVSAHRVELLAAATTLLLGFDAAGRPSQGLPAWGSYESWSAIVRDCLVWADYPDPLECREGETFQEDAEAVKLKVVVQALNALGSRKARELLELAQSGRLDQDAANVILDLALGPKGDPSPGSLGKRLDRWRGRVADGFKFMATASGGVKIYHAARLPPA
jgi:hypothetical protein